MKKIEIICQPNWLTDLQQHAKSDLYALVFSGYEHSLHSVNYNLEYCQAYDIYQDVSVCVYLDNQPVILLPLYVYQNTASFFQQATTFFEVPMAVDERISVYARLAKFLKAHFKRFAITRLLIKAHGFFVQHFLASISKVSPLTAMSVDLTASSAAIKANLRKSYKSLTNWGKNNLSAVLINQEHACKDLFNEFKAFHIAVAGKKTRSDHSWQLQFEMILSGEAFVTLYYLDSKLVAGNLILLGQQRAFYGVGVYDRQLMAEDNLALSHWPLLDAITKCKNLGLTSFDLGRYSLDNDDVKLQQIASFKKGFATEMNIENTLTLEFTHD